MARKTLKGHLILGANSWEQSVYIYKLSANLHNYLW